MSVQEYQLARERPQQQAHKGIQERTASRASAYGPIGVLLEKDRRARVDVASKPRWWHEGNEVTAIHDTVVGRLHDLGETALTHARRTERVDRGDAIAELWVRAQRRGRASANAPPIE